MTPRTVIAAALVLGLGLAACLPAVAEKKPRQFRDPDGGTFDDAGKYTLSDAEQKLDCKKTNGRLLTRILQLRAELADKQQTSQVAQSAQQIGTPVLKLMFGGGSKYGTDRAEQLKRDRAVLEAYNAQLATKGCPQFDLDAELKKGPNDPAPTVPVKAPAKK